MSVVAEWKMFRATTPAERNTPVFASYGAGCIGDFDLPPHEERAIANRRYGHVCGRLLLRAAVGSYKVQCTGWALHYSFGNRVCARCIDLDPRALARIEYLGKRANTCRAVNATRRIPLNLDSSRAVLTSRPVMNVIGLILFGGSALSTVGSVGLARLVDHGITFKEFAPDSKSPCAIRLRRTPFHMKRVRRVVMSKLIFALLIIPSALFAQEHLHQSAERLGTVHFQTSCSAQATPHFNRAVTLLHSLSSALR